MTAITIAIAGTPVSTKSKRNMCSLINDAFLNNEVGIHNEQLRRGIITKFETLDAEDIWVGIDTVADKSELSRAVLVTIRVMAGPWNTSMKMKLIKDIDDIIRNELEIPLEKSSDDIWTTFVEVPEGGWGVGGRQISIAELAPVFATQQQHRIGAYLSKLDSN